MSRDFVRETVDQLDVPRASGDEPLEYLLMLVEQICSPRERG